MSGASNPPPNTFQENVALPTETPKLWPHGTKEPGGSDSGGLDGGGLD